MTVTFFGHRNTPDSIQPSLKKTLIQLIEKEGADTFYVGNEGDFDCIVYNTLKELKAIYPFIQFKVMLAYLTKRKSDFYTPEPDNTVFPDELLKTPLKFAISKRNNIKICKYKVKYCKIRKKFEICKKRTGRYTVSDYFSSVSGEDFILGGR